MDTYNTEIELVIAGHSVCHRVDVLFDFIPGDSGQLTGLPELCYPELSPILDLMSVTPVGDGDTNLLPLLSKEQKAELEADILLTIWDAALAAEEMMV